MDGFLKWNCYDLAEQIEVFEKAKRYLSSTYEELSHLVRTVGEVSVEKSEQIRRQLSNLKEIIHRQNIEIESLEQAIDIYFAAETGVKMQVETLQSGLRSPTVVVAGATTTSGNAIMEDWLAALAFGQGS
jgi:archaellum component FlaC